MADIILAPSPLSSFMKQLGKSMGTCNIELVNDNARSHSPVSRVVKSRGSDKILQNRWKATYHSKDRAMETAYCRSPSMISNTTFDCYQIEVSRRGGRAHQRWSSCENVSSSSLTLTQRRSKRRPRAISNNKSPPRRNSADDYDATTTTTAVKPKDDYAAKVRPRRCWSSPVACTHAPIHVRRLSPSRREREHRYD